MCYIVLTMKYIFTFLITILFMVMFTRNVTAIPSPVLEFFEPIEDKKVRMAIVAACYKQGWELLPSDRSSISAIYNGCEVRIRYSEVSFRIDFVGDDIVLHKNPKLKKEYVRAVNALLHGIDEELK